MERFVIKNNVCGWVVNLNPTNGKLTSDLDRNKAAKFFSLQAAKNYKAEIVKFFGPSKEQELTIENY